MLGYDQTPERAAVHSAEVVAQGYTAIKWFLSYTPQDGPEGIRRNLARGRPLPPGIARQIVPLRMLGELPVVPDHQWHIAGRDLLLIAMGTLVVVEILEDVFE